MLNRKKIPILYCDIISLCDVPVGFHQMNEFSCISFSWQNSCAKADNQQTYSKELGVLIQAETQLTMYGSMCNNFSLQRRNQGDVFRGREGNLIRKVIWYTLISAIQERNSLDLSPSSCRKDQKSISGLVLRRTWHF